MVAAPIVYENIFKIVHLIGRDFVLVSIVSVIIVVYKNDQTTV